MYFATFVILAYGIYINWSITKTKSFKWITLLGPISLNPTKNCLWIKILFLSHFDISVMNFLETGNFLKRQFSRVSIELYISTPKIEITLYNKPPILLHTKLQKVHVQDYLISKDFFFIIILNPGTKLLSF